MGNILTVRGVERRFASTHGSTLALQATDLLVAENDFITILGPSGCGKSTLLRIVAGLDHPTAGEVQLDGRRITGPGADRGMVFQSYTLFPWLTVLDNVCFGLRERGLPRAQQLEIAHGFLAKVGLKGFDRHYPKQLSGGMQQRTALARALANDPRMLLMDEPFGALDHQTRELMQELLLGIWEEQRKTVLFVTHDIDEAERVVALAQRCQAVPPAFLHAVRMGGRSYVLRDLQPSADRVAFGDAKQPPERLLSLMASVGRCTAWAHLRASGRQRSAIADELIAWGADADAPRRLRRASRECMQTVRDDWKAYCSAYDDGVFALDATVSAR